MKITKRQLRRIIREEIAHQRYGLGKNIADAEFPIVVGYEGRSEIAYSQNELDNILDDITPGPRGGANLQYSLNSLRDMEPESVPSGQGIERYAESKEGEAAPFGSGPDQADLEPDEKEIVGHT
jgi:hypothetical protein